jgi:hypothetical protein
MKKLFFGLIAMVMISFSGNAQNLRANFLNGKTHDQIILDYNNLSTEGQNALWIEKLDQLLSQNLPQQHKTLIENIREIMMNNQNPTRVDGFIQNAVELAQITPLEDLSSMYESLYDYNFTGNFSGNTITPEVIIDDIRNLNNPKTPSTGRVTCSCRWCIGHEGHTGTNCEATDYGCGWFGFQSCNQCITC